MPTSTLHSSTLSLIRSSHNKFELLKLPLELREAIYALALAPVTSCQIIDVNKRLKKLEKEESERYETSDCACELRTSKVDQLDITYPYSLHASKSMQRP